MTTPEESLITGKFDAEDAKVGCVVGALYGGMPGFILGIVGEAANKTLGEPLRPGIPFFGILAITDAMVAAGFALWYGRGGWMTTWINP